MFFSGRLVASLGKAERLLAVSGSEMGIPS